MSSERAYTINDFAVTVTDSVGKSLENSQYQGSGNGKNTGESPGKSPGISRISGCYPVGNLQKLNFCRVRTMNYLWAALFGLTLLVDYKL